VTPPSWSPRPRTLRTGRLLSVRCAASRALGDGKWDDRDNTVSTRRTLEMTRSKSKAIITAADGAGGMRQIHDRRFEKGDWPIRFVIEDPRHADNWLKYLSSECTARGWNSGGIAQLKCDGEWWQPDGAHGTGCCRVRTRHRVGAEAKRSSRAARPDGRTVPAERCAGTPPTGCWKVSALILRNASTSSRRPD